MRNKLIVAGLLAAMAPGAALAQPPNPACVASNNASRTEGTVLGAGAGALLGSVLAGRHSRGEGAILGAVGGGIGGNVIAGSRNDPCPPGYYYGPNGPPPPNGGPPPPGGPGYYNNGYYNNGGPPPGGPGGGGFWAGAPGDTRQRIDFLQHRVDRLSADGRISPDAAQRAYTQLRRVRYYARSNYQRYGQLSPDQQNYIQNQLDYIGRSLHWEANYGY